MINLVVDIGNSSVKLGIVRPHAVGHKTDSPLSESVRFNHSSAPPIQLPTAPCRWWIASVNRPAEQWLCDWITSNRPADRCRSLTVKDIPIRTSVVNPSQIGIDRVCAAAAVNHMRDPDRPAVFVDFGTATTVNAISKLGVLLGGAILPGIQTQLDQLSAATDRLPRIQLANAGDRNGSIGNSTEAALLAGCYWGHVSAVPGLVERFGQELSADPQVWITGGGMPSERDLAQSTWQRAPRLVLEGISLSLDSITQGQSADDG